ncbi:MAG: UDP-N-acetylmuramoyl-tripeptide--D-alanyl-D-alanine ligase MurF [Roseibaca calidilacus]|uniref:UDP-N-acetylmuramoyl-tripeptide--D-alanyl-D-alanine ligase n=1 Tax=Roseibaca calidilacus TaxID=1666912 RepID=A0A0P7VYV4_9RHOB|nr:UDP-N-acetylmuramoyl-tripeptide--D-alanyl-D-alanine ligase [Roseibaca calidilacus]KPP92669.1 MAG: UDP-N-acetylmuramoyl-tripeptide--D-alanyl-D-alanine ligase MurF [Roseibaca calidilacus]CUX80258.1 UDP-N-acetylmuramoyl-tripeptide--D-alanyl-D-alanine ligase [Roseibaca calidilacus]
MTLWTAADAAAATDGQTTGAWQVSGISIDTRSLQPGDLFVALSAARDGHDFVADAFAKGAAAAMVSRIPEGVAKDAPLLLVPDVLEGLRALGAAGRARSRAKVIGITGSVGKTSTKDMARDMLAEFGKVHAAEASFNNHWGVPITLARLPQDADFAVVEMGMSNAGEIAPLTALARPNVAIVTAIAPAHLESLGSLEAIAQEKASIFAGLEPGGTAIFPAELPTSSILERTARTHASTCLPMGKGDLPLHLHDIRQTETALVLRAKVGQMAVAVRLINSGAHAASNALACLGVAHALGLDLARAAFALGRWQPPAGRGLRQTILLDPIEEASFTLIDDAFNANPASMAAALALLAQTNPADGGRRVAILGDMLELGPDEQAMHAALAEDPSMADIRLVHCVGARMAALHAALPLRQRGRRVPNAEALLDHVHTLVAPGDVVLVKGSKGSHVSRVVDALRGLDTQSSQKKGL